MNNLVVLLALAEVILIYSFGRKKKKKELKIALAGLLCLRTYFK